MANVRSGTVFIGPSDEGYAALVNAAMRDVYIEA